MFGQQMKSLVFFVVFLAVFQKGKEDQEVVLSLLALRWPGDSQRESGRLARTDSQKSPISSERASDLCESPQTCDSQFLGHRSGGPIVARG